MNFSWKTSHLKPLNKDRFQILHQFTFRINLAAVKLKALGLKAQPSNHSPDPQTATICLSLYDYHVSVLKFQRACENASQSQKTQGFCVADFATLSDETRSRSKTFPLFISIKEPYVRKFERLALSKLLGISQTNLRIFRGAWRFLFYLRCDIYEHFLHWRHEPAESYLYCFDEEQKNCLIPHICPTHGTEPQTKIGWGKSKHWGWKG